MSRVRVEDRSVEVSLWHRVCGAGAWIDAQVVGGTLHLMRKRVGPGGEPVLVDEMSGADRDAVLLFVSWWCVLGGDAELCDPPQGWDVGPAEWEFEGAARVC